MKTILQNFIGISLVGVLTSCTTSDGHKTSAQHIDFSDTRKFIEREDRKIGHKDHKKWDEDILRNLSYKELLLKQK